MNILPPSKATVCLRRSSDLKEIALSLLVLRAIGRREAICSLMEAFPYLKFSIFFILSSWSKKMAPVRATEAIGQRKVSERTFRGAIWFSIIYLNTTLYHLSSLFLIKKKGFYKHSPVKGRVNMHGNTQFRPFMRQTKWLIWMYQTHAPRAMNKFSHVFPPVGLSYTFAGFCVRCHHLHTKKEETNESNLLLETGW